MLPYIEFQINGKFCLLKYFPVIPVKFLQRLSHASWVRTDEIYRKAFASLFENIDKKEKEKKK